MRKLWIVLAVLAQLAVLANMVYGRESVLANGQRIFLRTVPIDPRDPFRGDFVRLRYEMNNVAGVPLRFSPETYEPRKGDRIYAVLQEPEDKVHSLKYLTNVKPESGQFIRGYINTNLNLFGNENRSTRWQATAKYGIEQLYVEQGEGLLIEEKQGFRGGMRVPLDMEVALDKQGTAILTGFRWAELGMELKWVHGANDSVLERDVNGREIAADTTLIVQITNVSDKHLLLDNPGDNCAFTIEPSNPAKNQLRSASRVCDGALAPVFINLAPSESYVLHVNLADPRWFVEAEDRTSGDLRLSDTRSLYRIVYRTPSGSVSSSSSNSSGDSSSTSANGSSAGRLWHGRMESRPFSG